LSQQTSLRSGFIPTKCEQTENPVGNRIDVLKGKLQIYGNVAQILSAKTIVNTDEAIDNNFFASPPVQLSTPDSRSADSGTRLTVAVQYQSKRQDRFFNSETFLPQNRRLTFTLLNVK
jgi:hypothetical protein